MSLTLPRPPRFDDLGAVRRQLTQHLARIQLSLEQNDRKNVKRDTEYTGRTIYNRITLADADATPDVSNGRIFVTANTGGTTITDFDGAATGQEIVVEIADANTTIDFTSSGLKGNGGADWSPGSGDFMRCYFNGTDWLCSVHEV